jgi:hypothetical protein
VERKIPWVWIALGGLLLLAPGTFGRLFLDLAEGLTLTVLLLPLIAGIGGFVAWQILQRRLKACPACGFASSGLEICPACGSSLSPDSFSTTDTIDASTATIDVDVVDDDRH